LNCAAPMEMSNVLIMFLVVVSLGVGAMSCAPAATDGELTRMCERLRVLREEDQDEAAANKCIAEAKMEGVSQRQALCRISAVNKTEYWVRCRTGEARIR